MNRFLKILDYLIIVGACAMGVIATITKSVNPWWIIFFWLFIVIISRIQIILMGYIINKSQIKDIKFSERRY